jgi:hypothetical protein
LRDDTPEAVKLQLRLALRGGRQQRRRCLGCGREGVYCKVWSSADTWKIESEGRTGIKVYWLCDACNSTGMTPELERTLQR